MLLYRTASNRVKYIIILFSGWGLLATSARYIPSRGTLDAKIKFKLDLNL